MGNSKRTDVDTINEDGAIVPVDDVKPTRLLDDTTTRTITSFEDAIFALHAAGITDVEKASDFEVADKASLVAVPMVFLQWRFNTGDMGEFVSIEAVTKDARKVVINDGSTGVRDQLLELTTRRIREGQPIQAAHAGLVANGGLRRSDYVNEAGQAGTTFYVQGLPIPKK